MFLVERIHEVAVHDTTTEVPGTTELVHEVGLVGIEEVDSFGEQRDELGLGLPKGEVPAAVEVADGVQFGVSEWFSVVFLIPGDDVSVDSPVVTFRLSARVVHAGADRRELDRATHHLPGPVPEPTEEVQNHAAVVVIIVETRALLVVASVKVTVVDAVLAEVRVGLSRVTGSPAAFLDDLFHPVTEPPGEAEGRDDAANLILRVFVLVVSIRGMVSVRHDRIADDQQVRLDSHEHVAVDIFYCHHSPAIAVPPFHQLPRPLLR